MIRRKTTHIFCDAKESTSVLELKRMIQGILKVIYNINAYSCFLFFFQCFFKVSPDNQRLYKEGKLLEDNHTLSECGFTSGVARAQQPACVGLAIRGEGWFSAHRRFEGDQLCKLFRWSI